MFKLAGTVKKIDSTVKVSEKFSKREIVVTDTSSMYPQDILFQLTQDKCSLADKISVNDQVEVSFNLRGREWTSPQGEIRYFNTLEAWRLERIGGQSAAPQDNFGGTPAPSAPMTSFTNDSEDDDLPF